MSEYNNPRPLPSASASDPCTIVDNAISFDKVLNCDSTVTTYTGKQILSLSQAIDKFGFGVAPFTFAQGGILQSKKLLVSNEPTDGFLYKYVGTEPFPLTVAAGTNPTVGGDWQPFAATSAEYISKNGGGSVQDFIDAQYTTVAELATGKFQVGQYVRLTDRAMGLFLVQSGGSADGFGVLDAGNDNTASIIVNGSIDPLVLGAKGDGVSDDSDVFINAAEFGVPIDLSFGTYLLSKTINLYEPFDFWANNSFFKIAHSGIGFHLRSSTYDNKINISSIKDVNFIPSLVTPQVFIKVGVESVLEPTNIDINGVHFRSCQASNSLIENERSYGLKIKNSAINECAGVGIAFRSSAFGLEDKYSYNCYIENVDITGIGTGVVIEGGKISINNSIIESCTQSAIRMTGVQYSPVVYCDNVYFEANNLNFQCTTASTQGYSLHSRIKDCFFGNNSYSSSASAGYTFIVENCKNFDISKWAGEGTFIIGENPLPVEYSPKSGDKATVIVISPKREQWEPLGATEIRKVPLISVQRAANPNAASSKICITRTNGTNVGYYEGVFIPTDTNGVNFSVTQIAGFSTGGGYPFTPTFSRNASDPSDMSLYVTFTGSGGGTVSITVEGKTGG